jgi:hypothetical protein
VVLGDGHVADVADAHEVLGREGGREGGRGGGRD